MKLEILMSCVMLICCSCSSSKKTIRPAVATNVSYLDNNNVIIDNRSGMKAMGSSNDEIIFLGSNNLVEINHQNAHYNTKNSHDVITIEGDGMHIIIDQRNVRDVSKDSHDTVIVKRGAVAKNKSNAITVLDSGSNIPILILPLEDIHANEVDTSGLVVVAELDTSISISEALKYYVAKAKSGDMNAVFQLGVFYKAGVGVKINAHKAVECFEMAAHNKHIEAQFTLGCIYEYGFFEIEPSIEKAKYYFAWAAKNGHEFALQKLNDMVK